jgi:hypothetical protein
MRMFVLTLCLVQFVQPLLGEGRGLGDRDDQQLATPDSAPPPQPISLSSEKPQPEFSGSIADATQTERVSRDQLAIGERSSCSSTDSGSEACSDPGFAVGLQIGNFALHGAYQAPTFSIFGVKGPAGVLWQVDRNKLRKFIEARKSAK